MIPDAAHGKTMKIENMCRDALGPEVAKASYTSP